MPKPLVAMTMNLSSREGVRKPSISGVRWSNESSKSSATRMSSASTVHARMGPSLATCRSTRRIVASTMGVQSPLFPALIHTKQISSRSEVGPIRNSGKVPTVNTHNITEDLMLASQSTRQPGVSSARYAKCVEVSKRVRWDIDRDVIRGRRFDFSKRFLPDGLSKVDRLAFLGATTSACSARFRAGRTPTYSGSSSGSSPPRCST